VLVEKQKIYMPFLAYEKQAVTTNIHVRFSKNVVSRTSTVPAPWHHSFAL
jgi:hypothetical protein